MSVLPVPAAVMPSPPDQVQGILEQLFGHEFVTLDNFPHRNFTQYATNVEYLKFIEKEFKTAGGYFKAYTSASNSAIFVTGAGVATNISTLPDGAAPVDPVGHDHADLRGWSGNDWGRAPGWGAFLARVALVAAVTSPALTSKLDDLFQLISDQATDHLADASVLIATTIPLDEQRAAMRQVVGLFVARQPELARTLHLYDTMITTVNYDFLLSIATNNDRQPQTIHDLQQEPLTYVSGFRADRIYHLHGLHTDMAHENGFTLFPDEYNHVDNTVALIRHFIGAIRAPDGPKSRVLVFVGAEGTLTDIHFEYLWEVLGKLRSGGGDAPWFLPHIVLCSGQPSTIDSTLLSEKDRKVTMCRDIYNRHKVPLIPVVYGHHGELNTYLHNNMPYHARPQDWKI